MKKGEKKRQQKALAKRAKRKLEQAVRAALRSSGGLAIRQACTYPIMGCWVQSNWREMGIAPVLVARRQSNGRVVFGAFLIDFYCLGVKNCLVRKDVPYEQFMYDALSSLVSQGLPQPISADLAHEMIYGSIEYAARWGFKPHPDFEEAQYVLDPPDMHPHRGSVTFGKDGKPFYISGPYDDANAVIKQLDRTAGTGNYDVMISLGEPPDDWLLEDE